MGIMKPLAPFSLASFSTLLAAQQPLSQTLLSTFRAGKLLTCNLARVADAIAEDFPLADITMPSRSSPNRASAVNASLFGSASNIASSARVSSHKLNAASETIPSDMSPTIAAKGTSHQTIDRLYAIAIELVRMAANWDASLHVSPAKPPESLWKQNRALDEATRALSLATFDAIAPIVYERLISQDDLQHRASVHILLSCQERLFLKVLRYFEESLPRGWTREKLDRIRDVVRQQPFASSMLIEMYARVLDPQPIEYLLAAVADRTTEDIFIRCAERSDGTSDEVWFRSAVVEALLRINTPESLGTLLETPFPLGYVSETAMLMHFQRRQDATPILKRSLERTQAFVPRLRILQMLGYCGNDLSIIPNLLEIIEDVDLDPGLRSAAMTAAWSVAGRAEIRSEQDHELLVQLAGKSGPDISDRLIPHLSSDSRSMRNRIATFLAAMGPGILPNIEPLLHFQSDDVRWHAVEIVGKIAPPADAIRLLTPVIEHDTRREVRIAAIKAVSGITSAALRELMESIAADEKDSSFVRDAAQDWLEKDR